MSATPTPRKKYARARNRRIGKLNAIRWKHHNWPLIQVPRDPIQDKKYRRAAHQAGMTFEDRIDEMFGDPDQGGCY